LLKAESRIQNPGARRIEKQNKSSQEPSFWILDSGS
jgi:hypothetical protein